MLAQGMEAAMRQATEERLQAMALQDSLQLELDSCRCSSWTEWWLACVGDTEATHVGGTRCCLQQANGPPPARLLILGELCTLNQHGPARPSQSLAFGGPRHAAPTAERSLRRAPSGLTTRRRVQTRRPSCWRTPLPAPRTRRGWPPVPRRGRWQRRTGADVCAAL